MSRVDGPLKVTGRATYAAEHPVPDIVHGVIVSSTVSRGRVISINPDRALAAPGVLRVLTDLRGVNLGYPVDQVNFFGQSLGVVVAATLEQAEHGATLVDVRYADQPGRSDIDTPDTTPHLSSETPDYRRGDPDGALRGASTVLDHTFSIARNYHNPMELPSTIAAWKGDRLTLWDKTQWVQGNAQNVATALGVPPGNIRVICPFIGGAFGSSGRTWPHVILTAFAAREMRRPVKVVLTRKQMYSGVGYRPTSRQRFRIGASANGQLTAVVHEGISETARYTDYDDSGMELSQFLYRCPHVRSSYRLVPLDVHAPTFMRGPGTVTGAFALESSMDALAHELGIDPIELRLRNEPADNAFNNLPFTTRRLADCYRLGAERFGWSRRSPTPRALREDNLLIGLGMATAAHSNNRTSATAMARVHDDGTAVVASATADMGPGTYTSMVQIAADALGLPASRVTFQLGDSTLPTAPMHSGSKTLASVGSAVFTACNALRDSFIRTAVVDPASPLHGASPDSITVRDGLLSARNAPGRSDSYRQILQRHNQTHMDTQQSWGPGDFNQHFSSYAYGAIFAEVSVDEMLATARIRRIFTAYDIGRVINPKLAHSQALSGMIAGIGMALLENGITDHRDGRIVNANMADYLVPVNADVPELDAVFLDTEEPTADPIGIKGLGELVMVGIPAAIANAVFNATGRRITELPITLDALL
ncbi:xanthine dehydrogenase family protein molybdopterin-binding subunit [Pseudonocardia spinosispora]|uniref:xanthine dehydrogenase family protein molybdopterin-binding subunit n=1 Tax=Pseudonocardia spinosispora TaxID=103441 RepID=UPI0009FE9E3A|nr:xanthine dehydrogenase family protein molybdopterin-binding subunit [Pseudonocardia spinosispora]